MTEQHLIPQQPKDSGVLVTNAAIAAQKQFITCTMQDGVERRYLIVDRYMYAESDLLGRGAFGNVYRGYHVPLPDEQQADSSAVAVKVQSIPKMLKRAQRGGNGSEKEKLSLESVLGDVISLKFLRHENIVRLLDVKRKAQSIYIVMEYCNQKDLDVYMKARQFSEAEVRYYFAQILEAFKYLNKKQLMHRDIKPQNIFVNNNVIKVGDFGFAKKYGGEEVFNEARGSDITSAPQVLFGEYSPKCDIYSLGCTLYWMLYKKFLYQEERSQVKKLERMRSNKFDVWPEQPVVSSELKALVAHMLQYEEEDRIGWQELFSAPLFNMGLLREMGDFNFIDLQYASENGSAAAEERQNAYESDNLRWEEMELIVKVELNLLDPKEYDPGELQRAQEKAAKHISDVDARVRREELNNRVLERLTFERGKCAWLRTMRKRLVDFRVTISQSVLFIASDRLALGDLVTLLSFAISKRQLLLLSRLRDSIADDADNVHGYLNTAEEWRIFIRDNSEREQIHKVLVKECDIFYTLTHQLTKREVLQLPDKVRLFVERAERTMAQFLADDFAVKAQKQQTAEMQQSQDSEHSFLVCVCDLVVQTIMHLAPLVEKYRDKRSNAFMRIRETIFLIDELLILVNMHTLFVWEEKRQINFNHFLEQRRLAYNDELAFAQIFTRVMKAISVYFQ